MYTRHHRGKVFPVCYFIARNNKFGFYSFESASLITFFTIFIQVSLICLTFVLDGRCHTRKQELQISNKVPSVSASGVRHIRRFLIKWTEDRHFKVSNLKLLLIALVRLLRAHQSECRINPQFPALHIFIRESLMKRKLRNRNCNQRH